MPFCPLEGRTNSCVSGKPSRTPPNASLSPPPSFPPYASILCSTRTVGGSRAWPGHVTVVWRLTSRCSFFTSLNALSFSDDSTLLAGAFQDSAIRLWTLTSRKLCGLKATGQLQQMTLAAGGCGLVGVVFCDLIFGWTCFYVRGYIGENLWHNVSQSIILNATIYTCNLGKFSCRIFRV